MPCFFYCRQENLNERATGAEREELHKQYKAELASDQRTVEEWQKVIGVDAGNKQKEEESLLTPEAQSLTEMFADSILTGECVSRIDYSPLSLSVQVPDH